MSEPVAGPAEILGSAPVIEALAALEHERWAHWQRYLHGQGELGEDGSITIPAALVGRWARQMATPYVELSEDEKESDREQVRRYLPVIVAAMRGAGDGTCCRH
ncbi:hypothetical protein [Micromonospora profundi]|uniref:Uncharacterized protein n=1 Tax=Micromonospora profundi TaxID=1420889 RepID=A0AAJ6HY80_9ACTN|nr:hypothetical protein [Micromonospora profundi]WLS48477.1 hypothetical protein Q3V37_15290 [Micromonospora profundi]